MIALVDESKAIYLVVGVTRSIEGNGKEVNTECMDEEGRERRSDVEGVQGREG